MACSFFASGKAASSARGILHFVQRSPVLASESAASDLKKVAGLTSCAWIRRRTNFPL